MKKLILTLTITLLALAVSAQNYKSLITTDLKVVRSISDSAAYNAKTKFAFVSATYDKFDTTHYIVSYKSGDKTMAVNFIKTNKRKGQVLDKPLFVFDHIDGDFNDLVPFWKSFIDSTATAEEINKKIDVKVIDSEHRAEYPSKILQFDNDIKMEYRLQKNSWYWFIKRYSVN